MPNAQTKPITEGSSSRTKILDILKAPKAEGSLDQATAKTIALTSLYPVVDAESFKVLTPESDAVIDDAIAAKALVADVKVQEAEAKVEALTLAGASRYLISSDYTRALDLRRQQNTGSLTLSRLTIPEIRYVAKKYPTPTYTVEGLTEDEFIEIVKLKGLDRDKCKVRIEGFETRDEASDLLTTFDDRAKFSQPAPFRILKECKVPLVARKK